MTTVTTSSVLKALEMLCREEMRRTYWTLEGLVGKQVRNLEAMRPKGMTSAPWSCGVEGQIVPTAPQLAEDAKWETEALYSRWVSFWWL